VNGIIARGFDDAGGTQRLLWLRNETNDHGLGVCDDSVMDCVGGGGDENELDNTDSLEIITLENTNGGSWVSLWVSSLDDGGTNDSETGTLLWSHVENDFDFLNSFSFSFNDISPAVEAEILGLAAASAFDPTAPYLAFIAGDDVDTGENNDYLVWKGSIDTPIPEPGTLGLMGLGLAALGLLARRRRSA
jgi:hypothetical protein